MSFSKFIHSRSRKQRRSQHYGMDAINPMDQAGNAIQNVIQKLNSSEVDDKSTLLMKPERLVDVEKIKESYLSPLLSTSRLAAARWKNDHFLERSFESSAVYSDAVQQVEERYAHIVNLPVELYLTEINHSMSTSLFGRAIIGRAARLMNVTYGPLHAALKVGDVFLEWDASSLVIPEEIDPEYELQEIQCHSVKFAGQVHHHGTFYRAAQEHKETVKKTIPRDHKKMKFTRQVEIVHDLGNHRERIINKLAAVIAEYNSEKEYDTFHCNCQHFVQDCLTALEIDAPQFSHEMQKQFTRLRRGGTISPKLGRQRFRTHGQLDHYYMNEDKKWNKDDLQYFKLLYYKFHLRAVKSEGILPHESDWSCQEDTCQLESVREELHELLARDLRFSLENETTVTAAVTATAV